MEHGNRNKAQLLPCTRLLWHNNQLVVFAAKPPRLGKTNRAIEDALKISLSLFQPRRARH